VVGHRLRLSLLQNSGTEDQDFFPSVLKASIVAKRIFADRDTSVAISLSD